MPISTGIGDEIGGPLNPSIFEIETRGIVNVNRELLGILRDTLQVSFTELGGQVWKYQASANRPVLPALVSTRMQTPDFSVDDKMWKEYYEDLLNNLPPTIREKLEYDLKSPLKDRDNAYIALENILTATARTLAFINAASAPIDPGSIEQRYAELNALLPLFTATSTTTLGKAFFNKAREFLDEAGANYIHRDKLSDTVRQAQYALDNMQKELDAYGN